MSQNPEALKAYTTFRDQLHDVLQHERNAWFALVEGLRGGADAGSLATLKAEQDANMRLATKLLHELDNLANRHFG